MKMQHGDKPKLESARTHQRLAPGALHRAPNDIPDVVLKALVQHPVRLVQYEVRHPFLVRQPPSTSLAKRL